MNWRRQRLDRALAIAPWILGGIFGAIALHLIAILALPTLAPSSFYNRMAARLPLGEVALPPNPAHSAEAGATSAAESGAYPFADPFATLALCRFDLRDGPLRVRAASDGERLFAVSVRLADGTPFYSVTERQSPKGQFNILLVTQAQADDLDEANQDEPGQPLEATTQKKNDAADDERQDASEPAEPAASRAEPADELRLIVPKPRGFVLFRVLSLRESDYAETAARRSTISCTPEKLEP